MSPIRDKDYTISKLRAASCDDHGPSRKEERFGGLGAHL